MKTLLLLACIVFLGANLAFAQPGVIGITADQGGTDCNLLDTVPGALVSYYVQHLRTAGATAAQFSAPMPACMIGAVWISDVPIGPSVGNSQIGIAIGYGGCFASPILILTINYFAFGATTPCCPYYPSPDPATGLIEMVDCAHFKMPAGAQCAMINPDVTCLCAATPTETSTWGKVKALYSE
ncbi:MAG: hypothetical protein JSW50_00030 [Candidatus Latescibacterota bacterium]|nr:MAG: hypothetical protein JSW50_00030 [Candidatus Latescibacterota bacterium]